MTVKDIIEHPAALVAGLLASIGIGLKPAILVAVGMALWQSAGTLFTGLSVLSFTVAPEIPFLVPFIDVLQTAAIATAFLFLAKLGYRTFENFDEKL